MPNFNIPISVKSIAFIDTAVLDYQTLADGVIPGTQVILLDSNCNGLEQIAEALRGETFSEIHIISHGTPGSLQLGTIQLSWEKLSAKADNFVTAVKEWARSLIPNAEILLYGCNVAEGNLGKAFVQRLSQLTGASVAASSKLTGSAALDGGWELDVTAGKIAASLAFLPQVLTGYNYVLSGFSRATNFSAGLTATATPISIAAGDLNGDGFPDLAVANLNSRDISILLGTGTGSFGTAANLFNPGNEVPNAIALRDFNADGNLDLAVANPITGTNGDFVSIRLGTGTGSFGNPTNFGSGINPKAIAAGDFNGDGKPDLATAGSNISILLGDGTGSFSNPVSINAGAYLSIATADFNGDNKLDLVASNNSATNNISVMLGNGIGSFSAPVNFSAGTGNHFVVTGDFNGDGKLDLAASNSSTNNVSVLLGNGTGNFGTATNFSIGSSPTSVVTGDFNADGKLDIAASNSGDNNVSVLLGDGTGSFGSATNFSVGTTPRFIAAADFNADGKLDLATPNFSSKNVSILLNIAANFGAANYSATEDSTDKVVNVPVTLNAIPAVDVTIPIAINPSSSATPNSDYTFSPTTITFPAGTTTLTQNIAVTIKSDDIPETDETVVFNLGSIAGGSAGAISQTTLTVAANDAVAYAVTAGIPAVAEGNTGTIPLTFTVTRSSGSGAVSSVNYAIAGTAISGTDYNNIGGTSGATGITGTVNFAAGETSKTITLDVLGDSAIEPDETITVTLSNPVAPGPTPTITTASATTTITNDDTAGIAVNPASGLVTTEAGGTATFTVKLNTQPSANVSIGLSSSNPAEGTVSSNSLTFTPANWNQAQTVTVTGVDDSIADGSKTYNIVTAAAVSTDSNYNNVNPSDVGVTNSDNETPGITVNPTAGLTTTEAGGKANFNIVLNTQPIAPVAIALTSSNPAEGTVSTNSLTFTSLNWNTPQTVTVTGADDNIADGSRAYTIVTAAAASTDPNYSNLNPTDVTVSNSDNDTAGVTISPAIATATEGLATGSYTITLNSQPIAPVTVSFNTGSQISAIAPINFDTTNWNVAQPVTVTAVDDTVVEGNHTGAIGHTATSTDTKYSAIPIVDATVAIADNDVAPVAPTPTPVTPTPTPVTPTPTPVTPTPTPVTPTPTPVTPTPTPVTPTPTPVTPTPTPVTPTPTPVTPTPTPTPVTPTPTPTLVTPTPTPVTPTPTPTPVTPTPTPVTPTPTPPVTAGAQKNWCGVEAGLDKLEKILDNQLQAVNLPIVGPLKNISPDFISNFKTKLVDAVKNGANQTISQLESSIRTALGPDFTVALTGNSTPDDSTLLITLGKQYQFPDINLSKNLGVPALSLDVDGKAKSKYNYNLSLGVGVSKEFGCYIDTDKTKLTANIDLGLDDQFKAKGNLGFFQVDLANDTKNPTKVDANLEVKLNDLDNLGGPNDGSRLTLPELQGSYQFKDLFNANLKSNANLGLQAKTSINGNAAFPSYNFDLAVNWPILNYANGQLTGPPKPTVAFNNMQLDLGTFINNFVKPVIGQISDVIKPLRPVIKFLNTDTKLLSQIGLSGSFDKNGDGQVSVLEMAAKLSGRDVDTRFLDAVAKVDKVVDLANQIASSPDKIDFGSYTLGAIDVSDANANLQNAVVSSKGSDERSQSSLIQSIDQQINSKTSGKVKEFLEALKDVEGLDLPLLTNPETAIQLLIGKPDVSVLSYQMPKLEFAFDVKQKFPIPPLPPPIAGLLEGNLSVSAHLGFGYDTYGLNQWKNSNFAADSADKVLDGFYVSDRENADGTGPDVDELNIDASINAGAGIDLKIAEGFVKGGIQGKVGIDLIDIGEVQPKQGGDGKIRTSEITSRISQPSTLFDVTGTVNAFLGAEVKSISVKFCNKTTPAVKVFGKTIIPAITIPYPCGLDYKTVYDNHFATFELAKFGVEPTIAGPRPRTVPQPQPTIAGPRPRTVPQPSITRGRTPVVPQPTSPTRGRTPVVPQPTYPTRGRTLVGSQSQSNDGDSTEPTTSGVLPTRGRAVNSYLAGAKVFFDADFNGIQDDREPFTITNVDGSFDLEVSLFNFDLNNSGDLEPDEGRIVISDGINTSTYLPQEAPLFATPDATVVTPLTTLMTELVEQGISVTEAQNQVKSGLGLSSEIDLTSYDPLQAITQNDPNGLAVYAAHASVQNTIVLVTNLISGASTTAKNEIADRIISTLANQIKSGTLDLSNAAQLQTIIQSAASELLSAQVSGIASDAAKIIAEGNQRIKAIASTNSSPSDAATEIARVQLVEQGEVAKDLQQVAAGTKTIQQAIAENTGASLNTQIQSATANNPNVGNTVTDDSSAPSNPQEPFPDSGIEFVKDGQNFTESTDGDDTLVGSAADDILRGQKGNDFLFSLDGNDWMNGNQGSDLTDGGIGDDTLYGGKGFDTLTGGAGNDFISGNRGEDILMGEKGDDTLYGGQGNDILLGGEGNDYLSGDLGDDTLVGGLGSDRFLLSNDSGIDTVTDFEDGKDLLILGNGVTFSQLAITESNGITQISFASSGQVFASLIGVSATAIDAADFSLL
ncbi:DUF4347 domain-containing protein [Microcoleus sp. ARI1-B5]|uniref:FG-GAP-like repeat-containing protein n=1 Tax=unclassified Microcoleus TaxID=2642155 RepID=UPI002FD0DA7C